jgi:tRNA dimethylallyltransferase
MKKQKLIVVLGPTATGKSDLAVKIAKDFNGEIISADSRQTYKGLDVGSGKITKKEMDGILHHLLDVASPKRTFTVAQFKKLAEKAIKKISSTPTSSSGLTRGSKSKKGDPESSSGRRSSYKIPIICGGTGFYIDAVVYDMNFPKILADLKLRKELENKDLEELGKILKKLDKDRFENIDTKNKVRLIRSIEVATHLGKTPSISKKSPYDVLWIGIDFEKEKLRKRIYIRALNRMDGMKKEVKKLRKSGLSFKRMEKFGLEYRNLSLLEQNKITEKEFIEKLFTEICQFAKRQRTWFKRNTKIKWFTPPKYSEIKKEVESFIKS